MTLVTDASTNLGTLFKNKMVKVKNRITKYFAENDIKIIQLSTDIAGMAN